MKLAYVCTNYNNSSFTLAAVDSLMRNLSHDIEVFVVDNASAEDEVRKLRPLSQKYPSVHVIESPDNTGYFHGLNVGLKALRHQRPDIEWVVAGNSRSLLPATTHSMSGRWWRSAFRPTLRP